MVSFRYFVLIMGKDKKKDVKTLSIRLPKAVAVALQKRAKKAQRSINGQIVHELEQPTVKLLYSEYKDFTNQTEFKEKLNA